MTEANDMGDGVIVLGPGPFSSNDPATEGYRQLRPVVPVTDDVNAASDGEPVVEGNPLKAGDFKDRVEAAQTQDDLDAIANQYAEQGDEFVTVEAAIEKRQNELDALKGGEK